MKERLADAIGRDAMTFADALGDAAVLETIAIAHELLLRGQSVIVEGFFQSDRYSADFEPITTIANSVLVHLHAEDSVLKERYEKRALRGVRHWIHDDLQKLPNLQPRLPAHMAEPLDLKIPQLIIDTTHRMVDIPGTVILIRTELQLQALEQSA